MSRDTWCRHSGDKKQGHLNLETCLQKQFRPTSQTEFFYTDLLKSAIFRLNAYALYTLQVIHKVNTWYGQSEFTLCRETDYSASCLLHSARDGFKPAPREW